VTDPPVTDPALNTKAAATDDLAFVVDLGTGETAAMAEISLASVGLKERDDLQRWIAEHPEVIGADLLLLTSEFDRWEVKDHKVADRLDLLFIDSNGSPLVAELKRDRASDTVELQALKYAAYCSQLTLDDLAEEYTRFHDVELEEARARLFDHAPTLEEHGPARIRIRVVAGEFGPAVTSVVLWLRDYDLDIGCIEVKARRADTGHVIISSRQIIPLPEAEDYLVRRRRKEQQEEQVRQEASEYTWEMYEQRYPVSQVAIARELFSGIEHYATDHELPWPWRPALRSYYMGFQRPGDYYVVVIGLRSEKPVQLAVKLPDDPARLNVANPYPELTEYWDAHNRQWCWDVPSLDRVPDVARALDISVSFQPLTGPMPRRDLIEEGPLGNETAEES
jgi:RecB family endonuclease NucS